MKLRLVATCLLTLSGPLGAQQINTVGVERETQRDGWWRLAYDNDFFSASDKYFTQGVVVEVVTPSLRKLPTRRVLIAPTGSTVRYGLAYEDDNFTASDLKISAILYNDHPYAATRQLRVFAIASDSARAQRISSSLNVGIIGQGAAGKEVQTFIHRHTGNTIPQGWGNQIRNDVILNYDAMIERALVQRGSHLLVTGTGVARVGTYNTAATLASTLMIGRVGTPFSTTPDRGRAFFLYAKPQLNIVGYDATLQGGLFNRTSPYVISAGDLSRVVYRHQIGIVFRSHRRSVEYYRTIGTREFRGGLAHQSGGFQFTMPLGR
jgi:lipid A 3-O-deacylase